MAIAKIDVKTLYQKDEKLKQEDVQVLLEWFKKQAHFPPIGELEAILFFHSCLYSHELTKTTIDTFYTYKTRYSDIFQTNVQFTSEIQLMSILPKKTPQGHSIFFISMMTNDSENYMFQASYKLFHQLSMLEFYENGFVDGFVVVMDMAHVTLGHVAKIGPSALKKYVHYLQAALPVRLKGMYFFNVGPVTDAVFTLMKSFMKKEVAELVSFYANLEAIAAVVPLECFPAEYGGSIKKSSSVLHREMLKRLEDNKEFIEWELSLTVDERKRLEKRQTLADFGVDGTFKKLQLD